MRPRRRCTRVSRPSAQRARSVLRAGGLGLLALLGLLGVADAPADRPLVGYTDRIPFGAAAPDAVKLTTSGICAVGGCGTRAWCAELKAEHFAPAGDDEHRRAPYKDQTPPIALRRRLKSKQLPDWTEAMRHLRFGVHYVFACRAGDTLSSARKQDETDAQFEEKWMRGKASWRAAEGFALDYPSTATCVLRDDAADAAHLIVLLTDLGWAALMSEDLGGLDLPHRLNIVAPPETRFVLSDRTALVNLASRQGLPLISQTARQLAPERFRSTGYGASAPLQQTPPGRSPTAALTADSVKTAIKDTEGIALQGVHRSVCGRAQELVDEAPGEQERGEDYPDDDDAEG